MEAFKKSRQFFHCKIVDISRPRRFKGTDDLEDIGLLARFAEQIGFYVAPAFPIA